jgi:hypothetical protein
LRIIDNDFSFADLKTRMNFLSPFQIDACLPNGLNKLVFRLKGMVYASRKQNSIIAFLVCSVSGVGIFNSKIGSIGSSWYNLGKGVRFSLTNLKKKKN